jgi:hypothetical protein
MILNDKIYKIMDEHDCLQLDGVYSSSIQKILQICEEKGINLTEDNFLSPIRKITKKQLLLDEDEFNDKFGSKRSQIESLIASFVQLFKYFSKERSVKIKNIFKAFNLIFKLCHYYLI